MTYCVGLPFFEQDVLPYLQEAGDGRVTVLASGAEYQSSFADFVTGAGIRYRFNPVRLPNPNSRFHPKVHLLLKPREARLLVASANLTPSGFQANLEIVDELSLSENGEGDLRAFGQFVQMLRALAKLDPRLPKAVTRELNEIADMLHRWVVSNTNTAYEAGPHFLHSIEDPLLHQILHIVPPSRVNEIVLVSPFFDEHCSAILELAAAYPKARMRLIKASDEGSLAGQPLIKLKRRLVVDEFIAADGRKDRRLHAKILMLRGSGHEWVISGSANLTRAGLLVATKHGGNLEAIVAREYGDKTSIRLLHEIKTHRLDVQKLFWHATATEPRSPFGTLAIIDAYLENRQIMILLKTESVASELDFFVVVTQGGQITKSDPVVEHNEDGSVLLMVRITAECAQAGIPISVAVEGRSVTGKVLVARSWVAVQSALSLTATQRTVRNSTRQLCKRVFADDDAASVVSDAISRFLGELAEMSAQPKSAAVGDKQAAERKAEPERQLSLNEFIISDEELSRLRDATTRTAETLSGLAALLRRLLIVADQTEDQHAPADAPTDGEEPEESEGHEEVETQKRDLLKPKAEGLLDDLTRRFQLTVREAMAQPVCPDAVPFILNLPDAIIAYLLLHARIRQKLQLEMEPELAYTTREILQALLSVEGVRIGTSFGWLVRAKASEQCRPMLQALLDDKARVGQLFAFVSAGLAVGGADSTGVTASVLGGLHYVTGLSPGKEITPEMQAQLTRVATASGDWIPIGEMEKVLGSYSPEELSALLSAQKWSRAVGRDYCQAVGRESGLSCGKLHMSLPANTIVQLKRVGEDVSCPFCHRVIFPLKERTTEINSVLSWFDFALAAVQ